MDGSILGIEAVNQTPLIFPVRPLTPWIGAQRGPSGSWLASCYCHTGKRASRLASGTFGIARSCSRLSETGSSTMSTTTMNRTGGQHRVLLAGPDSSHQDYLRCLLEAKG